MSRLPAWVFAALMVASGGAFFVVQHLKVTTPIIQDPSAPVPGAINPIRGQVCSGVDHRRTTVTFYLLHRADDVDVYVIDSGGNIVATLASGRHMRIRKRFPDGVFTWDGRLDNGQFAPDGVYRVQVDLIHQGRTVLLTPNGSTSPYTIKVESQAPRPRVTSVTPQLVPRNGSLAVNIRYEGNEGHVATMRIYRTDLPGRPRLVASFLTSGVGTTTWNGKVGNRPAPTGIYLVGMSVTDAACNTGRFPTSLPPAPGSTLHAGVTVRYLAAQPPLAPVLAGTSAVVYVDSRREPYRWAVRAAGGSKVLEHGSSAAPTLPVQMPRGSAGLYALTVRTGSHRTTVPLIASAPHGARILVVLPALSWQGANPVDDSGAGMPSTLTAGGPARLFRPLAGGLPSGFADNAALLAYLRRSHLHFDLTTDLALLEGAGPRLHGHSGVLLAGQERWIPRALAGALRAYVTGGGRVLSLGLASLRSYVEVAGTGPDAVASHPTGLSATDIFGVRHGAFVRHGSAPDVFTINDGLGLFSGTSGVFPGYSAYEPVTGVNAPGRLASSAGTSTSAVSVAGVALGSGSVVEVGLPGFVANLATRINTRELFDSLWAQLAGRAASPFS